ncbi:MAG: 16S rRNA (adenine(1518)-N(6)/adenine(1519)-N(6))-dimethyltransferase RsmA [Nitrososphaerota archaeon]
MVRLGQHFLIDQSVLDELVEYGELTKKDVVLEIGAGGGELTWRIAEKAGRVIAIEIDEKLAREAEKRLSRYDNVELIVGDVLKIKPSGFNKVVSNPPYYISTKLLQWVISNLPEKIVLTLQKEFALKLTSLPGSKRYVYTSFISNLYYNTKIARVISRNMFKPAPKVDSVIIVMERKGQLSWNKDVLKVVKNMFTQKKKTLKTLLKKYLEIRDIDKLIRELELYDIAYNRIYRIQPERLYQAIDKILNYMKLGGNI